eukprot:GHVS01007347.1.p1 GENE.GHVS01007347.1~~GHVS01007347.1.p1  ORF type:complete len:368 (+),score=70.67 GHVS01007347.1:67-1170(+)
MCGQYDLKETIQRDKTNNRLADIGRSVYMYNRKILYICFLSQIVNDTMYYYYQQQHNIGGFYQLNHPCYFCVILFLSMSSYSNYFNNQQGMSRLPSLTMFPSVSGTTPLQLHVEAFYPAANTFAGDSKRLALLDSLLSSSSLLLCQANKDEIFSRSTNRCCRTAASAVVDCPFFCFSQHQQHICYSTYSQHQPSSSFSCHSSPSVASPRSLRIRPSAFATLVGVVRTPSPTSLLLATVESSSPSGITNEALASSSTFCKSPTRGVDTNKLIAVGRTVGFRKDQEGRLDIDGLVVEALKNGDFRVLMNTPKKQKVLCAVSGKLRTMKIRISVGDGVRVDFSPPDFSRGRISYRYKPGVIKIALPSKLK